MAEPVKIHVLDREFLIACPEDEKAALLRSAAYLNEKMQEIRDRGKVVGIDRIAVMAALNLAHEVLQAKQDSGGMEGLRERLKAINDKLEAGVE